LAAQENSLVLTQAGDFADYRSVLNAVPISFASLFCQPQKHGR